MALPVSSTARTGTSSQQTTVTSTSSQRIYTPDELLSIEASRPSHRAPKYGPVLQRILGRFENLSPTNSFCLLGLLSSCCIIPLFGFFIDLFFSDAEEKKLLVINRQLDLLERDLRAFWTSEREFDDARTGIEIAHRLETILGDQIQIQNTYSSLFQLLPHENPLRAQYRHNHSEGGKILLTRHLRSHLTEVTSFVAHLHDAFAEKLIAKRG